MNTTTKQETLETRFNTALKEIRKAGVKARRNVMGCCRGCTIGTGHVDDNTPFIEHFGGQGNRFMFDGDYAYYHSPNQQGAIDKLYFGHDGLVENGQLTDAGNAVIEAFERNGIVIDWDRTDGHTIIVLPLESIPHRTPHEQALVVNALMDKYNLTAEQLLKGHYSYASLDKHLYELKYDDEYLDNLASKIRTNLDEWAEQDRIRTENNNRRILQNEINERHRERLEAVFESEDGKPYPTYQVDRIITWLEIVRPLSEFEGTGLMIEIETEAKHHDSTYSDRERLVQDKLFREIEALPSWVRVDEWEATKHLAEQYLIREAVVTNKNSYGRTRVMFVWHKPMFESYNHEARW